MRHKGVKGTKFDPGHTIMGDTVVLTASVIMDHIVLAVGLLRDDLGPASECSLLGTYMTAFGGRTDITRPKISTKPLCWAQRPWPPT